MTTRGSMVVIAALAGSSLGCAPTYGQLLKTRRYADAICLASTPRQAASVAQAVERDAAPRINLYPVHERELMDLVGETGRAAAGEMFMLRATTAHNKISVSQVGVSIELSSPRKDDARERAPVPDINGARDAWTSVLLGVTHETLPPPTPPSTHTVVDGEEVALTVLTLGLSRLFSSKPLTREVTTSGGGTPTPPLVAAIFRALTEGEGTQGFIIPAAEQFGVTATVRIEASDYLPDGGGRCELRIWEELELPPIGVSAVGALDSTFGDRFRYVRDLKVRTRRYSVSNEFGSWSGP